MKEQIINKIRSIQRCAEIIQEHWIARGFRNDITNLGIKTILENCKEAIDEIEKEEVKE